MKTYGYAQNKRKRLDRQAVTAYNEENIAFRNVIIRLSALHKAPKEERKVSRTRIHAKIRFSRLYDHLADYGRIHNL